MAGSPRIIARPTTRSPAACRRARVRQGQAFGGDEEAPSLTAAAPRRRWKYAVGTEECSQRGSNKRMECKGRPDWRDAPLTKKAPYKPDGILHELLVDGLGFKVSDDAIEAGAAGVALDNSPGHIGQCPREAQHVGFTFDEPLLFTAIKTALVGIR